MLPNTFYAKNAPWQTALEHGLDYAQVFFADYSFWGLGLLCPILLAFFGRGRARWSYIALLIWAHSTYVILVGGDVLVGHSRFFMPILPLIYQKA